MIVSCDSVFNRILQGMFIGLLVGGASNTNNVHVCKEVEVWKSHCDEIRVGC
jgi:hypothetical protein